MKDPQYLPPLEYAKHIGTFKLVDRSRQYHRDRDVSNDGLLRSLNYLWKRQRDFEKKIYRAAWTGAIGLIGWLATEFVSHLK